MIKHEVLEPEIGEIFEMGDEYFKTVEGEKNCDNCDLCELYCDNVRCHSDSRQDKREVHFKVYSPYETSDNTLADIRKRVEYARTIHGDWQLLDECNLSILVEEVGEVATAIQNDNPVEIKEELLDVIAVCVRWIEGR